MSQPATTDPNIILLKNVRLSYPKIFKPAPFGDEGGDPFYSANFILDKKTNADAIKAVEARIDALKKEKWKGKPPGGIKPCLRDGSERDGSDGYGDGVMFLSASSKQDRKPRVVNKAFEPLTAEDGKPYAGCYVHASVRLWAMDNKFGKRINAELRVVIFHADGEPFGAAPVDAESEFAGVDLDDESEAAPAAKPAAKKPAADLSIDDM